MNIFTSFGKLKLNWKLTIVTIGTIAVTMAVLAALLFYQQEQDVIDENKNYMLHKLESSESQISTCIDSINMTTQFFLADEGMLDILNLSARDESITTEELLEFQRQNVMQLERLVSNNPLLYSVRYYSISENVQEMMPILYSSQRMQNLSWASLENPAGWHFGYQDTAFSSLILKQNNELAGLVTEVLDFRNGRIGYIEATVNMDTMFPAMFENIENEFSYFVTGDGTLYFGSNKWEDSEDIINNNDLSGDSDVFHIKYKGKNLIVTKLYSKKLSGYLISVLDITDDVWGVYKTRNIFIALMIMVIIALAFVINFIVQRMLRQLYGIMDSMEMIQSGDLGTRIKVVDGGEMGALTDNLNDMLDYIQRLMKENIDREVLVKNSEIKALQNQINAHFIYNVLESIKMMAEVDEKYDISDAITSLGKLLRYSMRWVSGNVRVREELDYIEDYVALINLRYDFVIHLAIKVPDELMDQEIPKMSLQPIVENAILHGIEPLGEESTIYIKGWEEGNEVIIEVSDTGRGMTDEETERLKLKLQGIAEVSGGRGNGIGLKNVHDRIHMAFGEKYGLNIYAKLGCFTKVAINLPKNPTISKNPATAKRNI